MQASDRPYLFEVKKIGDPSIGYISIAESAVLPFPVQRVYWTYFTPHDVIRGNHAHRKLQQILVAVSGQIIVETINSQGAEESFNLSKPSTCLYIPSMCWRTLQFSHNAVLMCLASIEFNEVDYIRNYEDFQKLISQRNG
ncbi:MAG TPA: FdtA/QdtA family cupin domain-containing protein [Cyclobacteriaceae bacterium]|jgi:dTDP-4-dehydrorhamnose 3,5-epimerase-like enzyme|nr:FdtA/QdtA family cupin domain-containing protein [Cyclobacteriaceae bacterium]